MSAVNTVKRDPTASSVYLIGMIENGRVLPYTKVGVAGSVASRIHQMSTSSPYQLFCHHEYQFGNSRTAIYAESQAHRALADIHVRGEWFSGDPDQVHDRVHDLLSEIPAIKIPSKKQSPRKPQPPKTKYDSIVTERRRNLHTFMQGGRAAGGGGG